MSEGRAKVRCRQCELVNWGDQLKCRRCGEWLPTPIENVVERVVERVVVRHDPRCLESLERAQQLIAMATERLTQPCPLDVASRAFDGIVKADAFPTMVEMERAMILAAYEKSERKPLLAAQMLGIGKTTFYRKLREMEKTPGQRIAPLKLAA